MYVACGTRPSRQSSSGMWSMPVLGHVNIDRQVGPGKVYFSLRSESLYYLMVTASGNHLSRVTSSLNGPR